MLKRRNCVTELAPLHRCCELGDHHIFPLAYLEHRIQTVGRRWGGASRDQGHDQSCIQVLNESGLAINDQSSTRSHTMDVKLRHCRRGSELTHGLERKSTSVDK